MLPFAPPFRNRAEAGRRLAAELKEYAGRPDVVVLGLPRGGIPVAYEVARRLRLPLDVFLVRKLGVPGREELAMGAIASGGVRVLNRDVIESLGITEDAIAAAAAQEEEELQRRARAYRGVAAAPEVKDRTVLLVDDGLATGSTMRAAVQALRALEPASIIVAVPVAAADSREAFRDIVDGFVSVVTPRDFQAVGLWYEDFGQTPDREVKELLVRAAEVSNQDLPREVRRSEEA